MFLKALVICTCFGSTCAAAYEYALLPDSHLSFIFKEKQKEKAKARPHWDFLPELTKESEELFSLLKPSIGSSEGAGSTESPQSTGNTKLSLSSPSMNADVSIQNASSVMAMVQTHQRVLSTLYNPNILGNEVGDHGIAFERERFDESQCIAHANVGKSKKNRAYLSEHRNQLPSGSTRILGHGCDKNDLWIDLFLGKVKFASQTDFNTVYDTSLGFLAGYDRFIPSGVLTGAVGYNRSTIKEVDDVGRGDENQIIGLYQMTTRLSQQIYLAYSLFGSVNFNDFHRFVKTGGDRVVAKSSFTSGTLAPHFEFGYDWRVNDWFILEPFIFNDFFFNFQPSFSERGAPGFNQQQDALASGLYVVEPGVNLYQQLMKNWGLFILRQDVGYKRAQPIFGNKNTVAIIGLQDGIQIPTGLREFNLFILEFEVFARATRGYYGDVFYRGEFGSGLISNILHINVGHFF